MPTVPVQPQPLNQLRSRYLKALEKSYSAEAILADPNKRPGAIPDNVFDFEEGIRLIVSRDHYKGKEVIHVSGSFHNTYTETKPHVMIHDVLDAFIRLSGMMDEPEHFIVHDGIPHWFFPHQELN